VFDCRGAHLATHTLPAGKELLNFGAASAYVVSFDEFDLAYLERCAVPTH